MLGPRTFNKSAILAFFGCTKIKMPDIWREAKKSKSEKLRIQCIYIEANCKAPLQKQWVNFWLMANKFQILKIVCVCACVWVSPKLRLIFGVKPRNCRNVAIL